MYHVVGVKIDEAANEKLRLEEKQRAVRRDRAKTKSEHQPK